MVEIRDEAVAAVAVAVAVAVAMEFLFRGVRERKKENKMNI